MQTLSDRVTEPAASAFKALMTEGCRAQIVSAAAGPHDLSYAMVLNGKPGADAWRALPCTPTLARIERSTEKDQIKRVLPAVIDIGWAQFAHCRTVFTGPDLYQVDGVLLLGTMVDACKAQVQVNTNVAVPNTMTWTELGRAVKSGAVEGRLDDAAPPFRLDDRVVVSDDAVCSLHAVLVACD